LGEAGLDSGNADRSSLLPVFAKRLMVEGLDVVVCLAPWCNWLTRGPFKAESTGSIPVGATNFKSEDF
jgi:hypothetical protein